MTTKGWHEEMKLASYWWKAVTVDMAMRDWHEDVKLAVCW